MLFILAQRPYIQEAMKRTLWLIISLLLVVMALPALADTPEIRLSVRNGADIVLLSWNSSNDAPVEYFMVEMLCANGFFQTVGGINPEEFVKAGELFTFSFKPSGQSQGYRIKAVLTDESVIYSSVSHSQTAESLHSVCSAHTLTLTLPDNWTSARVSVWNSFGQEVAFVQAQQQESQINVSHLPAGTYMVRADKPSGIAFDRILKP
ncbi:MAG: T9SS C-terminal target domain-containing protein [Bacteroidetes bacterium]|jgi:hypothetical protein|nr:MAG: T9SS C-terminal target domain-containing protein [Bacteroidota bacterium]